MEQLGFFNNKELSEKRTKKQGKEDKNLKFEVAGNKDLKLTMVQVRLIIHCLREYKKTLKNIDTTGLKVIQQLKLKHDLEETNVLLEYLESLYSTPKRNKRINRFRQDGPGMETFGWLG